MVALVLLVARDYWGLELRTYDFSNGHPLYKYSQSLGFKVWGC